MKVEALEAIPYSLRFREPYVTARGQLTERDLLMVRARAEGLEGWGETAALSLRGGAGVRELATEVEGVCRDALLEGGFEPDRIWAALAVCRSRGASAPARAAVDIALHDLAAKAAGRPLWALLGSAAASPVVCNATLPAANPTALRELAERWAVDGFRTYKLKVGLASDMAQVATIRSVLGPEVKIRIDANAAWSVREAIDRIRAMDDHAVELAEEPVAGLEQLAEVRSQTRIPIAADESVAGERDARRAVELGACNLATVKLAKVGGIVEALEVAGVIPVYMSSALEGPVGIAAAAHCVQALPAHAATDGIAHGLATERLFSETVGRGAEASGDTLRLGDDPGLGVEVDVEALEARRLT